LKDRCTRVELEEYSPEHIAKIIKLQGITIVDDVLKSVAKVCRGNARQAVSLAQEVKRYQKMKGGTFSHQHWKELCGIVGILPLGLSEMELSLLRVLKDRPDGTSLTRIGACMGLSKTSIQADLELYPAKLGLIEITTAGRVLTPKGQEYLKGLK
jgi:Holliday junction resolvasome RuvABC ATP-dependent DNA helicase subunit